MTVTSIEMLSDLVNMLVYMILGNESNVVVVFRLKIRALMTKS